MIAWLTPGDPAQRTGGYLWNARMVDGLRALGRDVRFVREPTTSGTVVADGLAWPAFANPELGRRTLVVVHSLACHEGGDDDAERRSWEGVRTLIATSELTRREMATGAEVVIPGTARARRAVGADGRTLLCVGTLTPRKGHDRVLRVLATVPGVRLRCAGAPRDPAWARSLSASATELGVADRVTWLGELDDAGLAAALDTADVVVSAARYEAFGMAIAEAVARGLPVVCTPAGVVEHLPAGAVEVVGPEGLRDGVARLLADRSARRALADRAWSAAASLPDWDVQAARLDRLLTAP